MIHMGYNDMGRHKSKLTNRDFKVLLNSLKCCEKPVFMSGPLPAVSQNMEHFSCLLSLSSWLQWLCGTCSIHFTDNFNLFWNRPPLFRSNGLHPNRLGSSMLQVVANIQLATHKASQNRLHLPQPPHLHPLTLTSNDLENLFNLVSIPNKALKQPSLKYPTASSCPQTLEMTTIHPRK